MTNTITLPKFSYSMGFIHYRRSHAPNGIWHAGHGVWTLPRDEARAMLTEIERDYRQSMHEATSRQGRGSARARRIIREVQQRCDDLNRGREALIAGLGGQSDNVVSIVRAA